MSARTRSRLAEAARTAPLLACGVIAGPLFVLTFLVAGAARAGYDLLRHPVSSLALGDLGWVQVANFLVAGLLTLAFAVGLRRALQPLGGSTWGPLLVAVWALGLLGAGIFVTDPINGYPPGTPARLTHYGSTHAALHDGISFATFVALVAACFVFTRRFAGWGERGWAAYSAFTGIAFTVAMTLSSLGFEQAEGLAGLSGLFQRVAIIIGWCWLSLLALHLLLRSGAFRPLSEKA
ncbi:DUF998 domain-containing protein [Streptosporangium sp. NPDC020145]|uniref:DUF998 domain-containing protein n=1 Tax=Streptosporangium jomthongense TaxID=1193683 RepID=A0ABV8F495_9ACTN